MPTEMLRSLKLRDVLLILGVVFAFGGSYKGMEWALAEKASTVDMQRITQALERRIELVEPVALRAVVADSLLREILQVQRQQAAELRTVRNMICRQGNTDSYCSRQ